MTSKAQISAKTDFIEQQSNPTKKHYVFAYTITIKNVSNTPFQLISRHWIIEDANKNVEEVFGDGVIGEQPTIQPGDSYTYSSGAILKTEIGTMEGRYFMLADINNKFEVPIPKFVLSIPRVLH